MRTRTIGTFTEQDVVGVHTYAANGEEMTGAWDFPHVLHTADGIRYAKIEDKIAYIAVDEDEYGQPIIETWKIEKHSKI